MRPLLEQKIAELAPAVFKYESGALAGVSEFFFQWTATHDAACAQAWNMPAQTEGEIRARKAFFAQRCAAQCADLSSVIRSQTDETVLAVLLRLADAVAFEKYH